MRVWGASGGGIFGTMMSFGFAFIALPALAATQCVFTTECFESETCSDTDFSISLDEVDGGLVLSSDAGSFSVSAGGSDEVRVYVGVTDSAFHVLTHNANTPARYTTHIYDGPLVVSYMGMCEDKG